MRGFRTATIAKKCAIDIILQTFKRTTALVTKNANRRPHCVDLTPPVFDGNGNADDNQGNEHSAASTGKHKSARSRQPVSPAGAIRRNPNPGGKRSSGNLGKISLAAVVLAGTAAWTSSSSQPNVAHDPQAFTLKATLAPPAFFFDDKTDALENKNGQPPEDPEHLALDLYSESVIEATQLLKVPVENGDAALAMVTPPQSSPIAAVPPIDLDANEKDEKTANPDFTTYTNMDPNEADNASPFIGSATDNEVLEISEPETPLVTRVIVKSGDTLSGILNKHGVKSDQLGQLLTHDVVTEQLSAIEPGQVIELSFDAEKVFTGLTTRSDGNTRINIERADSDFRVSTIDLPIERKRIVTAGRIDQSLYLAAEQANLKQSTIMELANIFQWELDFARDIRLDDKFSLVYEQLYREGEYIGDGNILAAEFVRGGKAYSAIRFTDDDGESGYYSPDGQPKRRTFMRHPVDVVRITSKFDPNRLHPVLHKIRAHRGVDYGSPHGSPIYATADGRVAFSGAKNAYGNTVVLQHGEKFSTLYAHMSKISKKSKIGGRVKQGDVIGYVGKTGRVTGTHLHYEFRVNGIQIDPLKVELPAAAPIEKKYLPRLRVISEEMARQMGDALSELTDTLVTTGPSDLELLPTSR